MPQEISDSAEPPSVRSFPNPSLHAGSPPRPANSNGQVVVERSKVAHVDHGAPEATAKPVPPLIAAFKWVKELVAPGENSLKDALEDVLEDIEDGEVDASEEETSILKNILSFASLEVSDVMVPRSDIIAFDANLSLTEMRDYVLENKHSRFPVYDDSLDDIVGYIHMKDLVAYLGDGAAKYDVKSLLRPIIFAAPSMRVVDLLVQMRQSACHIAIVVDEYGGTDGLITMEDVCEELVGDIQDEHGEETYHMEWVDDHVLEADARVPVEELSAALQMSLLNPDEDEYDTLSGLIMSILGRIPARGEVVMLSVGVKAEVVSADPRRILKVRITRESHISDEERVALGN